MLENLFEGQELSAELKGQLTTVFESHVTEQTTLIREQLTTELTESITASLTEALTVQIKAQLEEANTQALATAIAEETTRLQESADQYITESVLPSVDKYLTAAVNEWLEANKPAIEDGQKVALAESFMTGLFGLASAHNVAVPSKDLNESLAAELAEAKAKLNEATDLRIEAQNEARQLRMSAIVDANTTQLSESQRDKLYPEIARVEFISESQYKDAVASLVESFFPAEKPADNKVDPVIVPVTEQSYERRVVDACLNG